MRGEPASAQQYVRDCKCEAKSNYAQQHGHDCLTQPRAATLASRVRLTGEQRFGSFFESRKRRSIGFDTIAYFIGRFLMACFGLRDIILDQRRSRLPMPG